MKHINCRFLLAFLCVLPLVARGQTAVVSAGGSAESGTHHVSYSVGQIAVGSNHTASFRLNEGVQQPLTVEDVSIGCTDSPTQVIIYPNPTTMSVSLKREGDVEPSNVRLYSIDGRLLLTEQWDEATLTLDLKAYADGVYMLQVDNKTYKITKR